jgi:hypothetical protein
MWCKIPHLGLISLFVMLSMADLALTGELLQRSHGMIYESNPVANWWLRSYGWPGLVAFKMLIVMFIVGLVVAISRLKPVTARRFLGFACLVLTAVIAYSGNLLWSHEEGSGPFEREQVIKTKGTILDQKLIELQVRLEAQTQLKAHRDGRIE